ncbi:hypothetical protein PRK78_000422 [Emydomyces testavorans]|uniref:Uncharacterized protein n=1 Tax=Emydomyces testavorans TaxID=2070801 RepID=A0AAF0DBG1_9EURO|nr:hypothetical protein PRK78_000422 [Emydomyces testavorans]
MGIRGLIQELGSGDRISLAKLSIDHLQRTSRPLKIAVDVSIWIIQAQAAQGGSNPELRTLFYRLARLIALPIHPIFVFDGPGRPKYKRGKLIARNSRSGEYIVRSAKRLIELFRFHHHQAPGEAEAECAKLQTLGIVDAVLSNDTDTIMFGSKVTLMNFSKETSKSTSAAATHVNVYRRGGSGSNVQFDVGGMVLFALLSGGDYVPAGVPKCGPKLAAEISRAGFGADLLDAIKGNRTDLNTQLHEWRERLDYELSTNESGYFRSKHKAVRIPESFPDAQILFDYAQPRTSPEKQLEGLHTLPWDQNIDINALKQFVNEEFGWKYLTGAHRFIRKIAPSLLCYYLRVCPEKRHQARICGRKENFNMDGLAELKLQFVPAHVVDIDLNSETPLVSQEQTLDSAIHIDESDSENGQAGPFDSAKMRKLYDPTKEQTLWVFEAIAKLGMADEIKSWDDEQKRKKLAGSKSQASRMGSRRTKKVLDTGMTPGALHRYGTVVKTRAKLPSKPGKSAEISTTADHASKSDTYGNRSQKTIADFTAFGVRSSKSGISSRQLKQTRKKHSPTSSDIEAATTLGHSDEGRLLSSSDQQGDSNNPHSLVRAMDRIETAPQYITISSASSDESPSPIKKNMETCLPKGKAKTVLPETLLDNSATLKSSKHSRRPPSGVILDRDANNMTKKSSQDYMKSNLRKGRRTASPDSSHPGEPQGPCKGKNSTQPRKAESLIEQVKHVELADIDFKNGFWTFSQENDPEQASGAPHCDEQPRQSGKRVGRVSILDLT